MTTQFPINTVEIISQNEYDEVIAIHLDSNKYFMGDVDGDVFVNAFNVTLKGGKRDDAEAIEYFANKYGFYSD